MEIYRTYEERINAIASRAAYYNKLAEQYREIHHEEDDNENHYTDAESYANEYYSEIYRSTTKYDNDWD